METRRYKRRETIKVFMLKQLAENPPLSLDGLLEVVHARFPDWRADRSYALKVMAGRALPWAEIKKAVLPP